MERAVGTHVNAGQQVLPRDIAGGRGRVAVNDILNIYSTLGLLVGLLYCFFGYRWFNFVLFASGFLLGFPVGFGISLSGSHGLEANVIAGLFGGVLFGFAARLLHILGVLIFGIFAGVVIGAMIHPYAVALTAAACGILAVVFRKPAIIILTSLTGGFSIVNGVFAVATEKNVLQRLFEEAYPGLRALDPGHIGTVLVLSLAVSAVGAWFQFRSTANVHHGFERRQGQSLLPGQPLTRAKRRRAESDIIILKPRSRVTEEKAARNGFPPLAREDIVFSGDRVDPGAIARAIEKKKGILEGREAVEVEVRDPDGKRIATSVFLAEAVLPWVEGFEDPLQEQLGLSPPLSDPVCKTIEGGNLWIDMASDAPEQPEREIRSGTHTDEVSVAVELTARREILKRLASLEPQGESPAATRFVIRDQKGSILARAGYIPGIQTARPSDLTSDLQDQLAFRPILSVQEAHEALHGTFFVEF